MARPPIDMESSDGLAEDDNVIHEEPSSATRPRQLPADLPKSLDDRQPVKSFGGETEMYDAWQGRVRTSFDRKQPATKYYILTILNRSISVLDHSGPRSATCIQSCFGR